MPFNIIDELETESALRIGALRTDLSMRLVSSLPEKVRNSICIYATGSLARLEANAYSDLDAFFYVLGSRENDSIEPVKEIVTFHHVIEAAKMAGFPDFSGGGEYLHFQYLTNVVDNIGSRQDDYINALTSRMLLILESTFLFNEAEFELARKKIIERYFIDFHDHSANFRPIFILNDVLRFWRTLCLNYEHNREWRKEDSVDRAKGYLKNLKLRFSRMMICYSFIAALLDQGPALSADQVIGIAKQTPIHRLRSLGNARPELVPSIERALTEYAWFLSAMNAPKDDVLGWIGDEDARDNAFDHSRSFIDAMYDVTIGVAEPHGYTRYLVI